MSEAAKHRFLDTHGRTFGIVLAGFTTRIGSKTLGFSQAAVAKSMKKIRKDSV